MQVLLGYISKLNLKFLLSFIAINLCVTIILKFYLENDDTEQLPTIIWWTPFMWENQKIISCEKLKCLVTNNRNLLKTKITHSLLFYGSQIDLYDLPLPRNNNINWAIFHEESPKNLAFFNFIKGQQLFNITSTFSRLSHMPLVFQYLKDVKLLTDLTYFKSLNEKNALLKDLAPVLYIQKDCQTPIQRDKYVKELMKYIKIDSYGDCLNNRKLPNELFINGSYDLYEDKFMHFVSRYKFIISIENAACNDYITEKLWRPLIVGSIPIYFGSPFVQDWLPNEKSAILIKNFESPKQLADIIHKLNNNDDLYDEYLDHKLKSEIRNLNILNQFKKGYYGISNNYEDVIPAFECYVCDNSLKENQVTTNVYNCEKPKDGGDDDVWSDHWNIGKCQAKVLNLLINNLKVSNISEVSFNNLTNEYMKNFDCD